MTKQNRFPNIKKGTTFNGRDIKFFNGTGNAKTPMDLNGVVIEMKFRADKANSVIFQFTTSDNSITITGSGVARMMPRFINVPIADYVTELILTFPNGTVKHYAQINWAVK